MNATRILKSLTVSLAAVLVFGTLQSGWAAEVGKNAEDMAIESATTPAQHEALAADFRAKADEARGLVKRHEAMRNSYEVLRRKVTIKAHMENHCDKLIQAAKTEATEYDALAAEHEQMAKEAAANK